MSRDELESASVIIFIIIVVGVLGLGIYATRQDNIARTDAFMSECQKDRKHYECVAMWRAGESRTTAVPVIVQVPR